MLHSESPLCQEHGCPEHSYNPIPAVDEGELVRPTGVEELLKNSMRLSMGELLHKVWEAATKAQHQVDVEVVKSEKNRAINALIPYLKHNHRDRPVNPNLYGGPTYSDATDCEACKVIGQLRRGK